MTFIPAPRPIRIPVNKKIICVVEPTEPSGIEPANRPTTAISDMLNKTCSKLEKISGMLNASIFFARGPLQGSSFFEFIVE